MPRVGLSARFETQGIAKIQQAAEQMQVDVNQLQRQRADILVFVSFSMPKASLCQWLQDAARVGAPVMIRGLMQQSFGKTLNALNQLDCPHPQGVVMNPNAFETYHIDSVPAVVLREGDGSFAQVRGDGTLVSALIQLSESRDVSDKAKALLKPFFSRSVDDAFSTS